MSFFRFLFTSYLIPKSCGRPYQGQVSGHGGELVDTLGSVRWAGETSI